MLHAAAPMFCIFLLGAKLLLLVHFDLDKEDREKGRVKREQANEKIASVFGSAVQVVSTAQDLIPLLEVPLQ